MVRAALRDIIGAVVALACMCITGPALAADTVIHAGRLFDAVSGKTHDHMSILIRGDRIVEVISGFVTPVDADVIDLSGATVLPGLIDCHLHLEPLFGSRLDQFTLSPLDLAFASAVTARKTLESGFTSGRNLAAFDGVDIALKRAIDKGEVPGPRLWVAAEPLTPTGGHGDPSSGIDPALSHPMWDAGIVDGADAARHVVRDHVKRGATMIKIMPSGGVTTPGDNPLVQLMTNAEIRAAIETAHGFGLKVAAHAHSEQAIDSAVLAGVDSIEHGTFASAESFRLMKEHGTYLVPTLYVSTLTQRSVREAPGGMPAGADAKSKMVIARKAQMFAAAHRAGIKIAFGSDTAGTHTGVWGLAADTIVTAREFVLMVENGMTPAEALMTATANAADLIGDSKDIGSIQPGRFADIVAVPGDPLTDIAIMQDVRFVMKGGVIVKNQIAPSLPSPQ